MVYRILYPSSPSTIPTHHHHHLCSYSGSSRGHPQRISAAWVVCCQPLARSRWISPIHSISVCLLCGSGMSILDKGFGGSVPPSVSGLFPLLCGTSCDSVPSPLAEGPYFRHRCLVPASLSVVLAVCRCCDTLPHNHVAPCRRSHPGALHPVVSPGQLSVFFVAMLFMAGHVACGAWFLDFAFVNPCVTAFREVHMFCGAVTDDQYQRLHVLHF